MDKKTIITPTDSEKPLIDEACKSIFEMEIYCHSADRHVVTKMIRAGYRLTPKPVTQK